MMNTQFLQFNKAELKPYDIENPPEDGFYWLVGNKGDSNNTPFISLVTYANLFNSDYNVLPIDDFVTGPFDPSWNITHYVEFQMPIISDPI